MQVSKNKFLNILLILQTALATLTQTRSEDLTEGDETEVFDFLTSINPSCQTFYKKFGSLDKMQWLIGFYIENMKTILENPNGTGMEDEQPKKFSETLLEINERFNRARKGICRSISDQCTENTSVEEEYEIMTTVFENTVKEIWKISLKVKKFLDSIQAKRTFKGDVVKLYNTGNQAQESIVRLDIALYSAFEELNISIRQRAYSKRILQWIETIGLSISPNLEQDFELLVKFYSNTDKETLYRRFITALMNLQSVFAYFNSSKEQEIILATINNHKKFEKMTDFDFTKIISDRIQDLSKSLQKQAKEYADAAKDKVMACLKVPDDPSITTIDHLNALLKSLRDLKVTNANDKKIKENIDFFMDTIRDYTCKLNKEQKYDEEFDLVKHLFRVFTTHLSTYRRLLLEIDANNKEKDVAHAELIKIVIYLKHVMFKARKALLSLEKTNLHDISESHRIFIATLPFTIVDAISTFFTLKKTSINLFEERAERLSEKVVLLENYSNGLMMIVSTSIGGIRLKSGKMAINNANISTSVLETLNGNELTDTNSAAANFSKVFRDNHKNIEMFCEELLNLRQVRSNAQTQSSDYIKESDASNYIFRSCTEMRTDTKNLELMAKETRKIVSELRESNKDGTKDSQDTVESRNLNLSQDRLIKVLENISAAFSARSKILKLQIEFFDMEETTVDIFQQISGQDQLADFALYSFKRLEICYDIILLISKELKFIVKIKNTQEYKLAQEKSREGRGIAIGNRFYNKLFDRQKDENQELDSAETEVFSALKDFLEVYVDQDQTNGDTSVVTIADDAKEEDTALVEFILDCFSSSNGLRDVKEMDAKMEFLENWIRKNTHTMHHYHAKLSERLKINRLACNSRS